MSFLKFLGKKETELKSQDLDLPPLPPPINGPDNMGDLGPPPDDELPTPPGHQPDFPVDDFKPSFEDSMPPEFPEAPPIPEESEMQADIPFEEENELPEPVEVEEHKPRVDKPIFIKIEKYKEVLKEVNKIKSDFEKSGNILSNMVDIKSTEDKELENWKHGLENIRSKLSFIDKSIFEEV